MKQLATVVALSALGILAWQLSYHLSSDALAMAIGLAFGALLCVGPLLLVLFSRQRQPLRRDEDMPQRSVVVTNNYYDNRRIVLLGDMESPGYNGYLPQGHSGIKEDAWGVPLPADRQMTRSRQDW